MEPGLLPATLPGQAGPYAQLSKQEKPIIIPMSKERIAAAPESIGHVLIATLGQKTAPGFFTYIVSIKCVLSGALLPNFGNSYHLGLSDRARSGTFK